MYAIHDPCRGANTKIGLEQNPGMIDNGRCFCVVSYRSIENHESLGQW